MGVSDVAWGSYPRGFLRQLQHDLNLVGDDPAALLATAFGAQPSDEFVKRCWPTIRDRWVIKSPTVRRSVVAELRAKGLGDTEVKTSTVKGQVDYLRSCRNSAALRQVVVAHLLAAGDDPSAVKSPVATRPAAEGRAAPTTVSDWDAFSSVLALTLAQMEIDQYLILNPREKKDYYVQFALHGPSGIWMEAVSNNFLPEWEQLAEHDLALLTSMGWNAPTKGAGDARDLDGSPNFFRDWPLPVRYDEVSDLAVRTLREVLDVRHPGLLSYRAFAKGNAEIILPNLGVVRETPPSPTGPSAPVAPRSSDDLLGEVKEMMKKLLGTDTIVTDDDDDIPVRSETVVTYVRVQKDAPVVTVFAPVLWEIGSPPDILHTINEINNSIRFARAIWDGKGILLFSDVAGSTLEIDQLATALQAVSTLGDSYAKELQQRYGGRVANGEALPPREAPMAGYL